MTDILAQLPGFKWRGLEAPPCESVSFAWDNDLAARGVPYVDVDVHDDVRRKSATFKVRFYFCEDVEAGAFTTKWPLWLPAIKTGSPDYMVHPLLGTVRARVAHVGGTVTSKMRDGVMVEVDFIETNEDPSVVSAGLATESDFITDAKAADAAFAGLGFAFPATPIGTSIFDAINQIRGEIFSIELSVAGQVSQILSVVSSMINLVYATNDNASYAASDALLRVWQNLYKLQTQTVQRARRMATRVVANDTFLDAFARDTGNSVRDIMQANLSALRSPIVPAGTTLRYYVAA